MATELVKGGVFDIDHCRKGKLTVIALEGEPKSKDDFVDVEILEGKVNYASIGNRLEQIINGQGTPGDKITVRRSLFKIARRRPELERA